MEEWENDFNQWVYETYQQTSSTSHTVDLTYVNSVLDYLIRDQLPEGLDRQQRHNFKHKVKTKGFSWCTVPALGNMAHDTALTIPVKGRNQTLIVLPVEKFFQTLKSVHEASGHARSTTMWKKSCKMRQFIHQQLAAPIISSSMIDYVLFPELFIRLMVHYWGINKVEAEFLIRQMSAGNGF